MTQRLVLPDRGYTAPQRLLPEGGSQEDVRRAINRVYDQLDRLSEDQGDIKQTLAPGASPNAPGSVVGFNGTTPTGGGITTPPGGTTGAGTTGSNTGGTGTTGGTTRIPVTFYVPENVSGVYTLDADGYIGIQPVTV